MVKENLELGLDCRWSDLKNLIQFDFFLLIITLIILFNNIYQIDNTPCGEVHFQKVLLAFIFWHLLYEHNTWERQQRSILSLLW